MRFLIAGVLFAALLVSGCTPASCEWSPPGPDVRSRPAAASALVPGPAAESAEGLAAAGGGRPRTGYPGLAAAFYSANDKNLSSGWGADLNCVLNVGEEFSVEAALGTVHYNLESGTRSGGFSAVTFYGHGKLSEARLRFAAVPGPADERKAAPLPAPEPYADLLDRIDQLQRRVEQLQRRVQQLEQGAK